MPQTDWSAEEEKRMRDDRSAGRRSPFSGDQHAPTGDYGLYGEPYVGDSFPRKQLQYSLERKKPRMFLGTHSVGSAADVTQANKLITDRATRVGRLPNDYDD